jgi:hypothetical protein
MEGRVARTDDRQTFRKLYHKMKIFKSMRREVFASRTD